MTLTPPAAQFPADLMADAKALLDELRSNGYLIASAESCTGGLIAALVTEIPGSSDVFDRGWVTYSNDAKVYCLGLAEALIAEHGAVSEPVGRAMAEGALRRSKAALSVAVTGIAGPGGGTLDKPVGLVHLAVAIAGFETIHRECRFGDIGRHAVRIETVRAALTLLRAGLRYLEFARPS